MADKEATVYIVDVGEPMGKQHGKRTETDLEWAMQYVWDRITSTVRLSSTLTSVQSHESNDPLQIATGRKTAHIGVVGLRTDGEGTPP